MSAGHYFDGVHYKLSAWERKLHALMVHCNAVADSYNRKFYRESSRSVYACFYSLCYGLQMNVSGDYCVVGVGNSYPWAFYLPVCISRSLEQGSVRTSLVTLFCLVAVHS